VVEGFTPDRVAHCSELEDDYQAVKPLPEQSVLGTPLSATPPHTHTSIGLGNNGWEGAWASEPNRPGFCHIYPSLSPEVTGLLTIHPQKGTAQAVSSVSQQETRNGHLPLTGESYSLPHPALVFSLHFPYSITWQGAFHLSLGGFCCGLAGSEKPSRWLWRAGHAETRLES
jgi:hypothetical protein